MKITVYADMLIITNMLINYFLLKIASLLSSASMSVKRAVASSAAGALISLTIFLPRNRVISLILKIVSVVLCSLIAFGFISLRSFFRNTLYLAAANRLFAGAMAAVSRHSRAVYINNLNWYFNISPVLLAVCILAVYAALTLAETFTGAAEKNMIYKADIHIYGNIIQADAFFDTGFKVKDILGHKPVVLCELDLFKNCLPNETICNIHSFYSGSPEKSAGIIPVFYSDVSGSGMLAGLKAQKVVFTVKNGGKRSIDNALIAVSDHKLLDGSQMIFGKEIYNMIGE